MSKRPSQKDLVAAVLIRDGRIRVLDAIYHLTDPDGTVHRVTRLAAIIWTLRHKDGWAIETYTESDKVATYVLVAAPYSGVPTVVAPSAFPDPAPAKRQEDAKPARVDPLRPDATRRVRGPVCDAAGCHLELGDIAPGFDARFVTGKCPKHGRKTVRV